MKNKVLYIVHAIDTEGPLFQGKLDYKKYKEEVKKLHHKSNKQKSNYINDILKSTLSVKTFGTKKDLLKNIKYVGTKKYRSKFLDDYGNPWIYNWFILNHSDWVGKNPRKRLIGQNKIYDLYLSLKRFKSFKNDSLYFHYHPKPLSEDYHRCGSTASNDKDLTSRLSQLLIERSYFPNCFRAGHVTERFDLHVFLEQWIPFDYSNNSISKRKLKPNPGRFGDWRFAPNNWAPYHPDFYEYQKKGNCKRLIARSLPIYDRNYSIKFDDVSQAFKEAKKNGKAILSFFGHDFRDMKVELDIIQDLIKRARVNYPSVKIKFSNGVQAIREVSSIKKRNFTLKASIIKNPNSYAKLYIKSNNSIFGLQPFLAIKYKGKFFWQNLDFEKKNTWSYLFDEHNILLKDVSKLSIAANSICGQTIILKYNKQKNKFSKINLIN